MISDHVIHSLESHICCRCTSSLVGIRTWLNLDGISCKNHSFVTDRPTFYLPLQRLLDGLAPKLLVHPSNVKLLMQRQRDCKNLACTCISSQKPSSFGDDQQSICHLVDACADPPTKKSSQFGSSTENANVNVNARHPNKSPIIWRHVFAVLQTKR